MIALESGKQYSWSSGLWYPTTLDVRALKHPVHFLMLPAIFLRTKGAEGGGSTGLSALLITSIHLVKFHGNWQHFGEAIVKFCQCYENGHGTTP